MEKSVFTPEYDLLRAMLRDARKRAGLTQVDLADRLGETQSLVSKTERGERRLDLIQLQGYCRAMGISLTEFVEEFNRRTARHESRRSRVPRTKPTRE